MFVLTRVLFITAILTIALPSENSTNSLKVEMKTKQNCKILIDILKKLFLHIYILKAVNHKPDQVNRTLWNSKAVYFRSDY